MICKFVWPWKARMKGRIGMDLDGPLRPPECPLYAL